MLPLNADMYTVVLLGVASVLSAFSIWWSLYRYLRGYLRAPSGNWRKIVQFSADSDAPIPKNAVTPQIRRQLILEGEVPAKYSNSIPGPESCELRRQNRKIFGFFHPTAAAGGGGERVLWVAIKQTLSDPNAVAALYISKSELTFAQVLEMSQTRFNITFSKKELERLVPIYLTLGYLVEAKLYPIFTLIGQMVGTAVLSYEAASNLVPDVWVDTVGLAFSYPLVHFILHVPIIAYVHYPWVQSDMLASLGKFSPKRVYWGSMLALYKWALSFASVVMANSSWTRNHLSNLRNDVSIVYPPCSTQSFEEPNAERSPTIVYLAQFRSEKRQEMLIRAFSQMKDAGRKLLKGKAPHMILIGSVRGKEDQDLVKDLDLYAREMGLKDKDYTILINAPWESVRKILQTSLITVNAMWNEHFGMGIVENMAAGLIPVVHASAGPMLDIVKDDQGVPGFLFKSKQDPDFAPGYPNLRDALLKALELSAQEKRDLSFRAYKAAQRFSDTEFTKAWSKACPMEEKLVRAQAWRLKRGLYD